MMEEPFNQLTPAQVERLAWLAEECGEVIHIIGKILRHGYHSYHPDDRTQTTNRELLQKELCDIQKAIELMIDCVDLDNDTMLEIAQEVRTLKWMHHQEVTHV